MFFTEDCRHMGNKEAEGQRGPGCSQCSCTRRCGGLVPSGSFLRVAGGRDEEVHSREATLGCPLPWGP